MYDVVRQHLTVLVKHAGPLKNQLLARIVVPQAVAPPARRRAAAQVLRQHRVIVIEMFAHRIKGGLGAAGVVVDEGHEGPSRGGGLGV